MLANERLEERHVPSHLLQIVRESAKQVRRAGSCVVVLLRDGRVVTWGASSKPLLTRHLHSVEAIGVDADNNFVAYHAHDHFLKWSSA